MWFQNTWIDMGDKKAKTRTLWEICQEHNILKEFSSSGLGALKKGERKCIKVPVSRLIGCNVALDEAAKEKCPNENRWDYVMDYNGFAFFIEIHPASTSEINCVVQKVDFVKKWLSDNEPQILDLPQKEAGARKFYWISSGGTDLRITPGSPQARKLVSKHIVPVGKVWDYVKIFGKN